MADKENQETAHGLSKPDNHINELERMLEHQRLRIDRLTEENKKLNKQLLKERRLRYAAKNLVVGFDKAIMAQIERLNSPSATQRKAKYQEFAVYHSEADELLKTLEDVDIRANYSTRPTTKRRGRRLAYKTLRGTYFIPRHLIALSLKTAIKAVKKTSTDKVDDEAD